MKRESFFFSRTDCRQEGVGRHCLFLAQNACIQNESINGTIGSIRTTSGFKPRFTNSGLTMGNKTNLSTIIEDATRVITKPAEFYRSMSKTGGFADPLVFLVVMAAVAGLIVAILSILGVGMPGGMAVGIGAVIMMPIFAVIGSFIAAAVVFVIWKLMGSEEPYETAYRCVAYAGAVYPVFAVLGVVPYLGSVASVVWGMYLMILASIEVHKLNPKTAYLVFGILGVLMAFINVSGEFAARNMPANFENFSKQMEKSGDMTPEEAGKAVGEFLKGIQESAQEKDSSTDP